MADHPDDGADEPLANPEHSVGAEVEPDAPLKVNLSTRTSKAWIRLLPVLVVLIVILVFVFQNPKNVKVSLFTFSGTLPLSVALIGAVILGALLTMALGTVRIFQLRKQVRGRSGGSDREGRRSNKRLD
jgi:uncharacterized integral membrane protein